MTINVRPVLVTGAVSITALLFSQFDVPVVGSSGAVLLTWNVHLLWFSFEFAEGIMSFPSEQSGS